MVVLISWDDKKIYVVIVFVGIATFNICSKIVWIQKEFSMKWVICPNNSDLFLSSYRHHTMYECGKWQCPKKKKWKKIECNLHAQLVCASNFIMCKQKHTICLLFHCFWMRRLWYVFVDICAVVVAHTKRWYNCLHKEIQRKTREDGSAVWIADTPHTHTHQRTPNDVKRLAADYTVALSLPSVPMRDVNCVCSGSPFIHQTPKAICKIRDDFILIRSTQLWLCASSIVLLIPSHTQQFHAKISHRKSFFFLSFFLRIFLCSDTEYLQLLFLIPVGIHIIVLSSANVFRRQRLYIIILQYSRICGIIMTVLVVVVGFRRFSLTSTNY